MYYKTDFIIIFLAYFKLNYIYYKDNETYVAKKSITTGSLLLSTCLLKSS